jgi:glycosyltransferase involved in cell wall biosynthesis
MLKVLHIIPSLVKGGAERLVLDLCCELSKRKDIDVRLIFFSDKNEYRFLSENIKHIVIPSCVIPSISGKDKINIDSLLQYVSMFKPDIIHSHLYEAEIASRWITFPGIKYITHCHDNMIQLRRFSFFGNWNKRRMTDYFERKLLLKRYDKCNNSFIAISNDTETFLEENLPTRLHRISLLHNAFNYDKFYIQDKIRETLIHDTIQLINVGGFVDKKNQSFLVDVVKVLKNNGIVVNLKLLGDGPNREKVENKIIDYGLSDSIVCTGNVNEVENYLHQADIYVHSATYEPFGLVLLEAMAAGLPVVCLDGKGNRDIMEEGKNGFMIGKQNAELFAEKIILLIKMEEVYQKISSYAREFAKKYDISGYVDRLLVLYKDSISS